MKATVCCLALALAPIVGAAGEASPSTDAITVTAMDSPPPRTLRAKPGDDATDPRFRTRWSLSLDASGRVSAIELTDPTLEDAVRAPLENAIRKWQFEPGTLNGAPALTETSLTVDVTLVPFGEDKYSLRVDDARTGGNLPIKGIRKTPKYPPEAIRHHRGGMVVLNVDYNADGHVLATSVEDGAPKVADDLVRAADQAVRTWTFQPESVGGHTLAGRVVVPICFQMFSSMADSHRFSCDWVPPAGHSALHDGDVYATAPAARLKSDVIGHTL